MKVDFVFSHVEENSPDLLFVEVENKQGESISIGRWHMRPDGDNNGKEVLDRYCHYLGHFKLHRNDHTGKIFIKEEAK